MKLKSRLLFLLLAIVFLVCGSHGSALAILFSSNGTGGQTIASIAVGPADPAIPCTTDLCTTTGLSSGTVIGTLSATLSPITPTFSYSGTNLHLSTTGSDSGGVCNSTNGAANASFQIISGDTIATNGSLTSGSDAICVAASESGVAASGKAFTITVGNLINATGESDCTGHAGSTSDPWPDICVQQAVNAAGNGDTVFLAAGNWAFSYSDASVANNSHQGIKFVGAGSGNTFDAMGHPNNPTWNQTGTYTRLYQTSGCSVPLNNCRTAFNGTIFFQNCAAPSSASHIFLDGSINSAGGDLRAILSFRYCPDVTLDDIRLWAANTNISTMTGETQINITDYIPTGHGGNATILSSIFSEPPDIVSGLYPSSQVMQTSAYPGALIRNNIFYMQDANPFYVDNATFTGNQTFVGCDSIACNSVGINSFGYTGCGGPCWAGQGPGSIHNHVYDNYFTGSGSAGPSPPNDIGTGGGINDPGTNGIEDDLQFIGNWIVGGNVTIDNCEWHIYPSAGCRANSDTAASANEINGFTITNNSIIGSKSAQLNAYNGGCNPYGTGTLCGTVSGTNYYVARTNNLDATQNYLSSPSDQYNSDATNVSPTVTGNYCAGTISNFTQTDSTTCATTGFTNQPTASFTLGPLGGGVVPFIATNFTAQYGAVEWYASTSATAPTPTSSGWSFVPPYSISATHGNTVYMWVMDSVCEQNPSTCNASQHISAATSQVVP